jgi:hypothetical protein
MNLYEGYDRYEEAMLMELAPQNAVERTLADSIIWISWRLKVLLPTLEADLRIQIKDPAKLYEALRMLRRTRELSERSLSSTLKTLERQQKYWKRRNK